MEIYTYTSIKKSEKLMTANYELIGFIAGVLTTCAFLPLVFKVLKTKSTSDFSDGWLTLSFVGLLLWGFYGIVIGSGPVIFFNFLSLSFVIIILYYKLSINKLPGRMQFAIKRYQYTHPSRKIRS